MYLIRGSKVLTQYSNIRRAKYFNLEETEEVHKMDSATTTSVVNLANGVSLKVKEESCLCLLTVFDIPDKPFLT